MIFLWQENGYRFDFDETRIIERIHLANALPGQGVRLFRRKVNQQKVLIGLGRVVEDGWVQLDSPLVTQPGDQFVAHLDSLDGPDLEPG